MFGFIRRWYNRPLILEVQNRQGDTYFIIRSGRRILCGEDGEVFVSTYEEMTPHYTFTLVGYLDDLKTALRFRNIVEARQGWVDYETQEWRNQEYVSRNDTRVLNSYNLKE